MTTQEFDRLIAKAESAAAENEDPKTALIFLHKILELVEEATYYAMFSASSPDKRIALANIKSEAHERSAQVIGFIQEMVSKEGKK